jgi:hypothetical protein
LKAKDDDIDSLELEFLARGGGSQDPSDRFGSSSLTPMLLDLDEETPTRDELANRFFTKPRAAPQAAPPLEDVAREKARFESVAFKERQRYLARYVAGAVAVSSAICLAAFFRSAAPAPDLATHAARAADVVSMPVPADLPVAAPVEPAVAPVAKTFPPPMPLPEPVSAPAASALTAPAVVATTASPAVAAPTASDGPSARESKDTAMHALEHGNWGAAISAGERSVRLDPSDGEAWLILGGAYQERGSDRAAHRVYVACAASAKPGHARSECASLAHHAP